MIVNLLDVAGPDLSTVETVRKKIDIDRDRRPSKDYPMKRSVINCDPSSPILSSFIIDQIAIVQVTKDTEYH